MAGAREIEQVGEDRREPDEEVSRRDRMPAPGPDADRPQARDRKLSAALQAHAALAARASRRAVRDVRQPDSRWA